MKHLLIRYGELTLKGHNRQIFINKLIQNLKMKLAPFQKGINYQKDNNSLILEINLPLLVEDKELLEKFGLNGVESSTQQEEKLFNLIIKKVQTVFGIYSLSIIEKTNRDETSILAGIEKILQSQPVHGTFKLDVTRKDKSYPLTSQELTQKLAPSILKNHHDFKVDIKKPEIKIEVVIKKDHADIFSHRLVGAKGLPVGVSGKALSLLSGGIDSPVASYLTMKRGMKVDFLHFMTPPHTTPEALNKVFKLAEKVAPYNYQSFQLYVCDFGKLLQELNHIPDQSYKIILMRRMFMRLANEIAKKNKHQAIITGESLGQVASQTIESMDVINSTSDLPILRPVLTYDKEEIIKIAEHIDTYETSILPFDDVCSMFVPANPVTKPRRRKAAFNEENLLWEELLTYTLDNLVTEYRWQKDHFEKISGK
ncbi:thiamine biosynthesis protein ThiI [Entomoplasma freundtii]|uniref:Probable tRNA sulfurtransferase n=1 Tax=Entomoplasma freundtii TaxID=74700 RepID=A0A2K8NRJ2_9MOLU|nr:tRNA uracil 4-sulfurtransferase ThiI [Entomoplasma freundtii]ATZ16450.1 thiamine biosynthesis protein ThiI [Entomoplasma freundtii]TDY55980.1 thiamine biosynthesis protein ThiI [Entomoplasma freundtii]